MAKKRTCDWIAKDLQPLATPVGQVTLHPKNVRRHDDADLRAIAASLKKYGQRTPIVANRRGKTILKGNGTHRAATELLGWTHLAVVWVTDDPAAETGYAIADNRTAELSRWDDALLASLLAEHRDDLDADLLAALQLDQLLAATGPAGSDAPDPQTDRAAELQKQWQTAVGQMWLITGKSEHRLLCGDSSDPRDVARLLAGEMPGVTIVDPPYQVADSVWSKWIADPSIVFGQARHIRMIPDKWWRFERVIVKKYRHRSATTQIDQRHAFVAQVGSIKTLPRTSETFPSVIEQEVDREHDHQKPVALLIEHMTKWTPEWSLACDPFAGSGSTLAACEMLGRRGCAMELSPDYVAVILQRMTDMGCACSRLDA